MIIRNPLKAVASMTAMVPFAVIGFVCVVLANVFVLFNMGFRRIVVWSGEATKWTLEIINGVQEKSNEMP